MAATETDPGTREAELLDWSKPNQLMKDLMAAGGTDLAEAVYLWLTGDPRKDKTGKAIREASGALAGVLREASLQNSWEKTYNVCRTLLEVMDAQRVGLSERLEGLEQGRENLQERVIKIERLFKISPGGVNNK